MRDVDKPKKQRRTPFARVEQTEHGTLFVRTAPRLPAGATIEDFVAIRDSLEGQAHARLYEILNSACVDPVIVRAPEVQRFICLVRELFCESAPGEPMELFLEPLETMFASMRGRAGGRPPAEKVWKKWADRNAEFVRSKPTLSARERYEDIAAEWEEKGNKSLRWTAIRDGILELRKRQANRV